MKTKINHISWKSVTLAVAASLLLNGVASAEPTPTPAPATVSLPISTFVTSVPVAAVIIKPVITTNLDASLHYIGFQGDFTFDETVMTFAPPFVQRAGLTGGNWNVTANILPGPGPIRILRVSAFALDSLPLNGSGVLYNLRMRRVSGTPGTSTALTWKPEPDNFLYIDDELDVFAPSQNNGLITITGPGPGGTPRPTPTPHGTPHPHVTPTPHGTPHPHVTPTPHGTPHPHVTPTPHGTPHPHVTPTPHGTPHPHVTPTPHGTPSPPVALQSLNISTRLHIEIGENVAIGGFMITGNSPKKVAIRGMGPSMQSAGFAGTALPDPTLQLRDTDNSLIASNDNWRDNPVSSVELDAAGLAPGFDLESAIVATLPAGAYTAIVGGKNSSTGTGLVEVYDMDQMSDARLTNISTRGLVRTGDGVAIGGFILGGDAGQAQVLLRAIGPSLTTAGIANALANPTLELRDSNGVLLQHNDDWKESQQAAIEATGIPPQNDFEAAILATLLPGAYTAIAAGKDGSTGVGLIEVYNLPSPQ